MTGYREHSNYELFGAPDYGRRPIRPFNWVQWTGVALAALGIAIDFAYLASRLAWIARAPSPIVAVGPLILGVTLVNSRRHPADIDIAPELAAARRRWLLIVAAVCITVLGAATIIDLAGAGR